MGFYRHNEKIEITVLKCRNKIHVKVVGKILKIISKISFLRYSTGEFSTIVVSFWTFWWKSFIKILFCRYAISFWSSQSHPIFPGEIPEISRKFSGEFRIHRVVPIPPHPIPPGVFPYHLSSPIPFISSRTKNPVFSNGKFNQILNILLPTTFMYIWYFQLFSMIWNYQ